MISKAFSHLWEGFIPLCKFSGVKFLFFSISGGEIFIIILFILIFFGADKIPGIARTMGRTMRQVKDATNEIQRDIQGSVKQVKDQIEKGETDDKSQSDKSQ